MLEDEKIKIYIASMNKIISNGNPKYLSYVCKEYMNAKKNNPVLAMILENMIKNEAKEKGSVYTILIDNDNGINLEAMSDISKITNTADFIKNIDALSKQEVDFGDLTSDELIIEGMQIAEELAKEIEELENTINYEDESQTENIEVNIDQKTENAIRKITLFGIVSLNFQKLIDTIKNKLGQTKIGVKEKVKSKRKQKKELKEEKQRISQEENIKLREERANNFIPKVDIDEEFVIRKMKEEKQTNLKSKKYEIGNLTNVTDEDFDDTSDEENNNTQEDDEPDI